MNKKQARIAWVVVVLISLVAALGGLVVFSNNYSGEVGSTLAGLMLLPGLPILLIGVMAFIRAKDAKDIPQRQGPDMHVKTPQTENEQVQSTPKMAQTVSGLGGWLILIAIGLFATPLHALSFYIERGSAYSPTTWLMLTTPGTQVYHPMWAFILTFEPIINIYFFLAAILLLVLFFKTKRVFKWLMIGYLVLNASLLLLDLLLAQSIPAIATQDNSSAWTEVIRSIASVAIWIPYLLRSKRVKATFLN